MLKLLLEEKKVVVFKNYFVDVAECMYVHHCVLSLQRSEESIRSPGTGVTGCCEVPRGCWEHNLVLWKSRMHFNSLEAHSSQEGLVLFCLFVLFCFFKTGFLCVALAVLELTL